MQTHRLLPTTPTGPRRVFAAQGDQSVDVERPASTRTPPRRVIAAQELAWLAGHGHERSTAQPRLPKDTLDCWLDCFGSSAATAPRRTPYMLEKASSLSPSTSLPSPDLPLTCVFLVPGACLLLSCNEHYSLLSPFKIDVYHARRGTESSLLRLLTMTAMGPPPVSRHGAHSVSCLPRAKIFSLPPILRS